MKQGENNTLESILKAAKTMVQRSSSEPNPGVGMAEHEYTHTEKAAANCKPDRSPELPSGQKPFESVQKTDERPESESRFTVSGAQENAAGRTGEVDKSDTNNKADADNTSDMCDRPGADDKTDVHDKPNAVSDIDAEIIASPEEYMADIHTVGIHFLEFAVAFLTLSKCQYHSSSLKVSSLPFFTLVALDNWAEKDYTMSELADKLQITKQQLSKMINMLEEKGLVERIHDRENRRRVYIRICDAGRKMMDCLKQEMLESTLFGLRSYSPEELFEMDSCICRLIKLMEKFNTEPMQEDEQKKAGGGE